MKYIVMCISNSDVKREIPIIFPDEVVHAHMAQLVAHAPELKGAVPVAAGFIRLPVTVMGRSFDMQCHGESETLNLKSRGDVDVKLIQWHDYTKGVEGAHLPF